MKTICFLSSMHTPTDKRVWDKEAVSLVNAGFRVIHIAPSDKNDRYDLKGVDTITYPRPKGILARVLQLPRLYWLARKVNADFYHCNEIDSWFVGALLKLLRRKKVIFDVHEHYPSTFAETYLPGSMSFLGSAAVRFIFRVLVPFTDRIVFAKRSVVSDFRCSDSKKLLVQNFTSTVYSSRNASGGSFGSERKEGDHLMAIHVGLINRSRGWPQLLEALTCMESNRVRVRIIGTFNDGSFDDFKGWLSKFDLDDRVSVREWMEFDELYKEISSSDVGLILFQPVRHNHTLALPHKMFDYMVAGLPIIAPAFAVEVAEIVSEADCGILIDTSNSGEIADALDMLAKDNEMRKRLGENGRQAALYKYNWENEAEKLIAMYRSMSRFGLDRP